MPHANALRVVVVCGALPVDLRYLRLAAAQVQLTIYGRSGASASARNSMTGGGMPVRFFDPVITSRRGHLAYVYRGMAAALDRDCPDVVHVVSEPWGLLAVQAAAWVRSRPGTRLVLHGCDTIWHHGTGAKQVGRRLVLRYTLPVVSAWLAENTKALDLATASGLPFVSLRARIHTNPRDGSVFRPPTDEERARSRTTLGVADDRIAVGLLGRLVPEKGVRVFLDAADRLLAEGFPGQFLIGGSGPLAQEVARRSSAHIVPLGPLSHPRGVLELLHAIDVFACPSLTTPVWEDQGPRVLLEAMMCGCIPMGTATGGIPEMLDGHGVLAKSTDPLDVAEAIKTAAASARIAGDGDEGAAVARWAHGVYSADAVALRLVDIWRDVAAHSKVGTVRELGM